MKKAVVFLSAVLMTTLMVSSCGGGSSNGGATSNEASGPNESSAVDELTVGSDVWMTDNLDVDKFRNGDPIPEAKSLEEWEEFSYKKQPAWSYFENDAANGAKYGKLYNWYAVNDPRGLAPEGWHVATLKEWENLVTSQGGFTEETAKKFMSTKDLGLSGLKEGNDFNFNAKFGGGIIPIGSAGYLNFTSNHENEKSAYWWTSTKSDGITAAKVIYIISNSYQGLSIDFNSNDYGYGLGLSVRCVKD
jgi:uncharacterized protein (TIGR02145 family)